MLRADKEDVVGFAFPNGAEQAGHQFDQTARLLELFILFEQRDNILETRMEGISSRDLVSDRFGATIGHFGFACLFQFLAV